MKPDLLDILVQSICDVSNEHEEPSIADNNGKVFREASNDSKPVDFWADFGYNVLKKIMKIDPNSLNNKCVRIVKTKKNSYGKCETIVKDTSGKKIKI